MALFLTTLTLPVGEAMKRNKHSAPHCATPWELKIYKAVCLCRAVVGGSRRRFKNTMNWPRVDSVKTILLPAVFRQEVIGADPVVLVVQNHMINEEDQSESIFVSVCSQSVVLKWFSFISTKETNGILTLCSRAGALRYGASLGAAAESGSGKVGSHGGKGGQSEARRGWEAAVQEPGPGLMETWPLQEHLKVFMERKW